MSPMGGEFIAVSAQSKVDFPQEGWNDLRGTLGGMFIQDHLDATKICAGARWFQELHCSFPSPTWTVQHLDSAAVTVFLHEAYIYHASEPLPALNNPDPKI